MSDLRMRKRIRLARSAYEQPDATWLVTVGAIHRYTLPFANPDLARDMISTMERYVDRKGITVFAGCLMPEHLHLVIATHGLNLIDVIGALKSLTTRDWWKHGGSGEVWQRSFHDEGLRVPAAFERAMEYVLLNPQEEGLVANWEEYPFRFSTV